MSADILKLLNDAADHYGDGWRATDELLRQAAAEIVRLRGEVADRADDLTTAYMAGRFDAKPPAPAEAKGDGHPAYPEGNVLAACACGSWPGGKCLRCEWTPQPAGGEAVAPFTHVCRFSDEFPWELTVHGKKHCEKCVPLYTHPPAAQVQPDGWDAQAFVSLRDAVNEWKERALDAEATIQRLTDEFNAANGPTHMGEAVIQPAAQVQEQREDLVVALRDRARWGRGGQFTAAHDTEGTSHLLELAADALAAHPSACELGADDVAGIISRDKRVWALAALAEKCGAVKDEGESGLFWTLTLGDFYKLEAALQHRGDSQEVGRG